MLNKEKESGYGDFNRDILSYSKDDINTPCFIFNENEFQKNITNFKKKLDKYFKKSIIGYSFKTNSLPRLLCIVKEKRCYAEVVSDDEYLLACKMGFVSNNIIFNGPVKNKEMFDYAIENGSIINIDSKRELDWLVNNEYNKEITVGIRVNFDLETALPGHTSTREKGGRFGFSYESGDLSQAIKKICSKRNVKLNGLHMHVSNASKSVDVYECLAKMACKIILEENLSISYIDFGGGYFGGGDDGEEYDKYMYRIYQVLKQYGRNDITIIVEPGASVVATAFKYITTVVDRKTTVRNNFVITDGTRLHIDPFFNKEKYKYKIKTNTCKKNIKQVICGYTCMEKDRIMEIEDAELKIGDRIEYDVVGSYTMCFNSLFITYLPKVYSMISNNKYILVRDKWSVEEYIQKNRWLI